MTPLFVLLSSIINAFIIVSELYQRAHGHDMHMVELIEDPIDELIDDGALVVPVVLSNPNAIILNDTILQKTERRIQLWNTKGIHREELEFEMRKVLADDEQLQLYCAQRHISTWNIKIGNDVEFVNGMLLVQTAYNDIVAVRHSVLMGFGKLFIASTFGTHICVHGINTYYDLLGISAMLMRTHYVKILT